MKLHFYFVDIVIFSRRTSFRYEVAEVDEKSKTYILKENPPGIYGSRIRKENIGKLYDGKVILTERNDEMAKGIFIDYYKSLIEKAEREISRYQNCINTINEWNKK